MTNEEWGSAFGNFKRNQEAIQMIPQLHLHRRRLMAPEFWRQQRGKWLSDFVKEMETIKKNNIWAGSLRDARMELFDLEEEIKKEEKRLVYRKKKLEDDIQDEKVKGGNAIFDFRVRWGTDPSNSDHWSALMKNPTARKEAQEIRTITATSVARLEQEIRDVEKRADLKKLQDEKEMVSKKISWIHNAEEYLEGAKNRAATKSADINTQQAKEYQELFPPTCPEPDPVPDLNVEIMKALAELRTDISPADQVSQKEANGEYYETTSAFSKGPMAKNPLGARGVDAVQVSSHRGPPTDRPPDRPDPGKSVSGGVRWRGRAPDTLYTILRLSCPWLTV
jgi:predicted  nucleic acid-binding Zn-ribbon protein